MFVMDLEVTEIRNDYAGEDHQQFNRQSVKNWMVGQLQKAEAWGQFGNPEKGELPLLKPLPSNGGKQND
jgi:hypothetical protein